MEVDGAETYRIIHYSDLVSFLKPTRLETETCRKKLRRRRRAIEVWTAAEDMLSSSGAAMKKEAKVLFL